MYRPFLLAILVLCCAPAWASAEIVTGAGAGGGPHVKVFSADSGSEQASFFAYSPGFSGGVRVATGDVNGDGTADIITGTGAGGGPHVKVFDGLSGGPLASFFAYDPGFTGGIFVGSGDVDNDAIDDIITGADMGAGPHVKVFSGQTGAEIKSLFAYTPSFTGGVRVAAGDVNNDGFDDIITGSGPGGGPHVKVFSSQTGAELQSFFAYDLGFTGGVFVGGGDVDNDGFADIITGAGAGAGPHVKVFSGQTGAELHNFFAYDPAFTGGVRVAAGDVNGDGYADIVTGAGPVDGTGPTPGPHVKVFDGQTGAELQSFLAYERTFEGGVFVSVGNVAVPEPSSLVIVCVAGACCLSVWRRQRCSSR